MDDTPTPIFTPLNVAELAKRHGVSKRTIQRRIRSGQPLDIPKRRRDKRRDKPATPPTATPATTAATPAPIATAPATASPPIASPFRPRHLAQLASGGARIAATAFCVAPAAALNIWPRLHDMIAGQVEPTALGLVALQTVSVAVMAATPFALERPGARKRRIQAIGAMCLAMNFYLAMTGIGSIFDTQSDTRQTAINKNDSLRVELSNVQKQREALPSFKPTTQAMVDAECGKNSPKQIGPKCKALQADQATTDKASQLDKRIGELSDSVRSQGTVPKDPHEVAKWWPMALAMGAELLAMYGGHVLTLALCL